VLERSFEILVRLCARDVFPGDWELIAQQLSLPSGRLDLLFADSERRRHLIELKKGSAKRESVDQANRYGKDLTQMLDGATVIPWVVAHGIPSDVADYAGTAGVRTCAISTIRCDEIIKKRSITEADLIGKRREAGVLHGGDGKGGLRRPVDNAEAFGQMPAGVASLLRALESVPHFEVRSGGMQTVIHYRGVKLGGVNRSHRGGVAYLSEGVVLHAAFSEQLRRLGFRRMSKTQAGSGHEHSWWETSSTRTEEIEQATRLAREVVDRALRIEQEPFASSALRGLEHKERG
jgi:hypothetical protein